MLLAYMYFYYSFSHLLSVISQIRVEVCGTLSAFLKAAFTS